MRRTFRHSSALAGALAMAAWLIASPAAAQHHGGGGGASHGGGGGSHGGGGGSAVSRGGSSGGGSSSGASSGGTRSGGSTSGGSISSGGTSGGSVARQPMGGSNAPSSDGGAVPRGTARSGGTDGNSTSDPATPGSRPRGNNPAVGTATPRQGPPPSTGGTVVVAGTPWFVPWGMGGVGYYGMYGGGWCDPMWDPDCGDIYGPPGYGPDDTYNVEGDARIHLKVTPSNAQVFVDGYYAGVVDDFDGFFQRLRVTSGPHHIEIREDGYETLTFDVNAERSHTLTLRGELKPIT